MRAFKMFSELLVSQVTLALNQMNDFVHNCLTLSKCCDVKSDGLGFSKRVMLARVLDANGRTR